MVCAQLGVVWCVLFRAVKPFGHLYPAVPQFVRTDPTRDVVYNGPAEGPQSDGLEPSASVNKLVRQNTFYFLPFTSTSRPERALLERQ